MAIAPRRRRRRPDDQILEIVYRRYLPKLEASLRKHLRDPQRAKELAHEAFTRAAKRANLINIDSLRAYLFRIVRNLRYERARIEKGERVVLTVSTTLALHASEHPTPCLHEMFAAECAVELAQIAKRLKGRRKVVFELSLDGHEHEEIARRLKIPKTSVAQDLHQARREIAEMWNEHGGPSHGPKHSRTRTG